jgi:hypothetical protein
VLPDRARRLLRKFAASPTLPILGWTKAVESLVAGGPLGRWLLYAALVTVLWTYAEDIQAAADDVVDEAATAIDDE